MTDRLDNSHLALGPGAGFKLHSVYIHSLNEELLDEIPLEQRLLFKMGARKLAIPSATKSYSSYLGATAKMA